MIFPEALKGAAKALARPRIKLFEAWRSKPYRDAARRVWTIGYGFTKYEDGTPVGPNDPEIDVAHAAPIMEAMLDRIVTGIEACVTRQPTAHELAAFISLCFNIGVGVHDGVKGDFADSTLLRDFNSGQIAMAADQFLVWDKAHDPFGNIIAMPGLLSRRKEERTIFLTPDAA